MVRAQKQTTLGDEAAVATLPAEAVDDASEDEGRDRDYETILTAPTTKVHWVKAKAKYLGPAKPRVMIDLIADEG